MRPRDDAPAPRVSPEQRALIVRQLGAALADAWRHRALPAERDENTRGEDFLPSERVALARDLEPFERDAAKARQRKHGGTAPGKKNTSGKFPGVSDARAKDKIAAAVGVPRTTLAKVERPLDIYGGS